MLATIDYRLVFIGSMLPDIIDKPTWLFAFGDIFSTGRGYAHSFLFNLVLLIISLALLRYRKTWLLVISLSSFIHLILDRIWNQPLTLWWPFIGPLPRLETAGWYSHLVEELTSAPSVYIPEILGLMVLVLMGTRLTMKKRVIHFFTTGVIE
jgi:inner membrane protein